MLPLGSNNTKKRGTTPLPRVKNTAFMPSTGQHVTSDGEGRGRSRPLYKLLCGGTDVFHGLCPDAHHGRNPSIHET